MDWATANSWAERWDFNGIDDWRLPTVTDIGNDGCNFGFVGTDCSYNVNASISEMALLF